MFKVMKINDISPYAIHFQLTQEGNADESPYKNESTKNTL